MLCRLLVRRGSFAQNRRADKTGLIYWKSNKYSVPMAWQRANVGVAEHSNDLTITDLETGDPIAVHELCAETGRTVKTTYHSRDHDQSIVQLKQSIAALITKQTPALLLTDPLRT